MTWVEAFVFENSLQYVKTKKESEILTQNQGMPESKLTDSIGFKQKEGRQGKLFFLGLFGCPEVGGSEKVESMSLFFLENENLYFFYGVWMVIGKCN